MDGEMLTCQRRTDEGIHPSGRGRAGRLECLTEASSARLVEAPRDNLKSIECGEGARPVWHVL